MPADPFLDFVLHLADGRRSSVARPEGLAISPDGRVVGLFCEGASIEVIDVDRISDVAPGPGAPDATRP